MTYHRDLAPYRARPVHSNRTVYLGWLDPAHDYLRGSADPSFVESLRLLLDCAWEPFISPGIHFCELCPPERSGGSGTLWIPGVEEIYVSPHMVLHYIEKHAYLPPAPFISAVATCPAMNSPEYFAALARLGIKGSRPPWAK